MVLIATTTAGHSLAFKVDVPATTEDIRRLTAIQAEPGMVGCEWTGREGENVR